MKKRSGTNPQPETVFFIDRDLGAKKMADALRAAGLIVHSHDDHLDPGVPDERWLEYVGSRGWIAISKDTKIAVRKRETDAAMEHGVRLFLIETKPETKFDEMVAAVIAMKDRMVNLCSSRGKPFIAKIYVKPPRAEVIKTYKKWLEERGGR